MAGGIDESVASYLSDMLKNSARNADDFGKKLFRGSATVEDGIGLLSKVLNSVGMPGKIAAKGLDTMSGALNEVSYSMRLTAENGVIFGNNMGEYNELIKSSNLTLEQFSNILSKNSSLIAGLGGNMDKSAKILLAVSKDVQKGLGTDLIATWHMSVEELNDITALQMLSQRSIYDKNKTQAQSLEDSANAAKNLAYEFALTSSITGKNRKALEEEYAQHMRQAEIQAAIVLKGTEWGTIYGQMHSKLQLLSPELANLVSEIATYGTARTKEAQAAAAIYAPIMDEVSSMVGALNSGNKELAIANTDRVLAEAASLHNSKGFNQMVLTVAKSGNVISEALMNSSITAMEFSKSFEATKNRLEREGKSATVDEILKEIENDFKNKNKGLAKDGTVDTGQSMSRMLEEANLALKAASGETAKIFTTMNNQLGKELGDFSKIEKELSKYTSTEGIHQKIKPVIDDIVNGFNYVKETIKEPTKHLGDALDGFVKLIEEATAKLSNMLGIESKHETRETGTLGETGYASEPTDFFGMVHKGETVMTPEHIKNFMSNATNQGALDTLRNMNNSLLNAIKEVNIKPIVSDIEKKQEPIIPQTINIKQDDNSTLTDKIMEVNNNIIQLVKYTKELVDTNNKELSAIRNLSNNRLA